MFELFIFSEIFEFNREYLKEGNSLMLTLIKNYSDDNRSQRRINVKRIIPLKELINKKIANISFIFNKIEDIKKLKKLPIEKGETVVKVYLDENEKIHEFKLKNKRKLNNELLNSLNLSENVLID